MAYPQTAPVQPLGVPVRGMNTRDPLSNMSPEYAPWVLNMEPEPQHLRVRNGYVKHSDLTAQLDNIVGIVSYGYSNLFAYGYKAGSDNKIYDVTYADWVAGQSYAVGERVRGVTSNHIYQCSTAITASDTEPVGTGAGTEADDDGVWTWVKTALAYTATGLGTYIALTPIKYARRAAFVSASTGYGVAYGGSWAALGFTYDSGGGAAMINATCGTSYRGRTYLFNGYYLYYSDITGVTGACTRIDLEPVITTKESIVWAGVLTDSTNKPTESMLAFGTSDGEVLVYAGDNPGATNWELVAKLKLAPVLNYQPILEIEGDIWLATAAGIISIRSAIANSDYNLEKSAVTAAINPYWIKLVAARVASLNKSLWSWLQVACHVTMTYWPEQHKVYVAIWSWLDKDLQTSATAYGTILVYNLVSGAWAIHQQPITSSTGSMIQPKYLTYFNDNIYYVSPTQVIYKVGTGHKDQSASTGAYAAIPYALHSAYIPGKKDQNQVIGFEPLMKTDFTGSSVTIKAAADFGRKVSAASSQALLAAGGHQNPFYRVGVDGKFYQYRLEGNSDVNSTIGLELYNMGVAIK